MKEAIRSIVLLAVVALPACGGRQDGTEQAQDSVEPAPAVSEERARSIAAALGADNGYDPEVYSATDVRWLEDEGAWWLVFEHAPPTPPGGHFAVQVDGQTGQARLMHGE